MIDDTVRLDGKQSSSRIEHNSFRHIDSSSFRSGSKNMIRALSKSVTALAIIFLLSIAASAQPQLPAPIGLVSDYDGKLSPQTKESLETLLKSFRERTGVEVAVVTMAHERLQGYPINEYALRLFRQWGIGTGQQKLGLLLLIALKPPDEKGECQGESRLEVGRHLEGDVPDGLAWELIRRMRDDLKACRIDQGMTTGVKSLLATVAQSRGVSIEGIDSNQAYRPQPKRASRSRGISPSMIIFAVFIIFVIIAALSGKGRGGPGGRGGRRRGLDGAEWMLLPIIFGSGGGWGGSRSGSDWGGGGWSGGDSGGFGGFGGGGDAGGGGASDSW